MKSYSILINIGDKEYKGTGETMLEALTALPMPEKIMSKSIVTIAKDEKTHEMPYAPVRLKRLFWKNALPINAKHFNMILEQ